MKWRPFSSQYPLRRVVARANRGAAIATEAEARGNSFQGASAAPLNLERFVASAAVSELDRPARVGARSAKAFVGAESTAQEVVPAATEEPVKSALAEETICAIVSAKIISASSPIDAVMSCACGDFVIATACADDIPPAPASHDVVSGAGDNDIPVVRTHNVVRSRGAGHRRGQAMTVGRRTRGSTHHE